MKRCDNGCGDPAEVEVSWLTSCGAQSAAMCGVCAAQFWDRFKHTPAGQSAVFVPVVEK